jgi:hypothetical protein
VSVLREHKKDWFIFIRIWREIPVKLNKQEVIGLRLSPYFEFLCNELKPNLADKQTKSKLRMCFHEK